jgi:hypothetical protein
MEVYPVRLEAPHVTLSDAELAQIEAELESWCLESAITLDKPSYKNRCKKMILMMG